MDLALVLTQHHYYYYYYYYYYLGPIGIFADLPNAGFKPLSNIFSHLRPDIAVVTAKDILLCELTVCHESNLSNSKLYKTTKYKNVQDDCLPCYRNYAVKLHTLEVSVLGHLADSDGFIKLITKANIPSPVYSDIVRSVVQSSYFIYKERNNIDNAQLASDD